MERQTNFKVVIRVRPPLPRELSGEIPFQNIVAVDEREKQIIVSDNINAVIDYNGDPNDRANPYNTHSFQFDYVYDQNSNQKKIFETTARNVVESALQGYNATIFAYGQTGTGKTYTMEGFNRERSVETRGIIPRSIEQIFGHIHRYASPRMRFLVRASYLQIYNEQISDLLKPERSNLIIREDKKRGVYVDGISEWVVKSPAEIYGLMERGGMVRATGETKMNVASSRSHAVFIIIAEQSETLYVDSKGAEMSPEDLSAMLMKRGVNTHRDHDHLHSQDTQMILEEHIRESFKVGKLNLVDLAGSERVRLSGATGQRLEESKQINKSLSALGNVIAALTDKKGRQHIPYRDSKLTRILEDSLGGNCKTTMMAMISPALESILETLSTLKFANRAKNIRNEARVNEDLDQKSLLRKYERELKRLRAELETKNRNVVDKRKLLEVDEQRRRAEADKMAAIRALESRSLEFMKEKEEKKRLEERIKLLMGQMIRGERGGLNGASLDETGAMHTELQAMMKQQQEKLRAEYENKLADLERERETIEEERAQVDRYKQLLLKQRDIMIALTQRLVERDDRIMSLQPHCNTDAISIKDRNQRDEVEAYDSQIKVLQEKLDTKTTLLIKMQRVFMEANNRSSPYFNENLVNAIDAYDLYDDSPQQQQQQQQAVGDSTGSNYYNNALSSGSLFWGSMQNPPSGINNNNNSNSYYNYSNGSNMATEIDANYADSDNSDNTDWNRSSSSFPFMLPATSTTPPIPNTTATSSNSSSSNSHSLPYSTTSSFPSSQEGAPTSASVMWRQNESNKYPAIVSSQVTEKIINERAETEALRKLNEILHSLTVPSKDSFSDSSNSNPPEYAGYDTDTAGDRDRDRDRDSLTTTVSDVIRKFAQESSSNDIMNDRLTLLTQLNRLKIENNQLNEKLKNSSDVLMVNGEAAPKSELEISKLKSRCDSLLQERGAVLTILDKKINVLLQSVGQAVHVLLTTDRAGGGGATAIDTNLSQALSKDLNSLQRLVSVSVNALKKASEEEGGQADSLAYSPLPVSASFPPPPSTSTTVISVPTATPPSSSNRNNNSTSVSVPVLPVYSSSYQSRGYSTTFPPPLPVTETSKNYFPNNATIDSNSYLKDNSNNNNSFPNSSGRLGGMSGPTPPPFPAHIFPAASINNSSGYTTTLNDYKTRS